MNGMQIKANPSFGIGPQYHTEMSDIDLANALLNKNPRFKLDENIRQRMVDKTVGLLERAYSPRVIEKTVSLLLKLEQHNLEVLKVMKPRKIEQTITVNKLSDKELLETIKEVNKVLPRNISYESDRDTTK